MEGVQIILITLLQKMKMTTLHEKNKSLDSCTNADKMKRWKELRFFLNDMLNRITALIRCLIPHVYHALERLNASEADLFQAHSGLVSQECAASAH